MDGDIGGQAVRVALRDATGPVHERLHRAPPFVALAGGALSLEDYATLMGKLGAYYFGVSEHVGVDRGRLALLGDDIAALDAPSPLQQSLAGPRSEAARLGWRYVVDGSIFGGRVIYRQLDYLFGASERGRRFFGGSPGAAAGWQRLCGELERVGADRPARTEMIAGARAAFAAFEQLVGEPEPADA